MPWPNGYAQVKVVGAWFDIFNHPMVGSVTLEPDREIYDITGSKIIVPAIRAIQLTGGVIVVDGQPGVFLLATNDPNVTPQGWQYRVTVNILGGSQFLLDVDKDAEEIDITDWRVFQTNPQNGSTDIAFATVTALNTEVAARTAKDVSQDAAIALAGGGGALQAANNLSDLENSLDAIENLGLGSAALADEGDFVTPTNASDWDTAVLTAAKAYTDEHSGGGSIPQFTFTDVSWFEAWGVDGDTVLSSGGGWDVEVMPGGNILGVTFAAHVNDVITFSSNFMRNGSDAHVDFAVVSKDHASIYYYLGFPDGSPGFEGSPWYYGQSTSFPAVANARGITVISDWIDVDGNITICLVSKNGGTEKIFSSATYPAYFLAGRYRKITIGG